MDGEPHPRYVKLREWKKSDDIDARELEVRVFEQKGYSDRDERVRYS